ncbi:Quinone oxidoreductase [Cupriavidus taiwanensis]|uniref:quinone oxidoreductase family protein n=1 Tax=Cupriavidus taiwanensis TaxID=164546 RepID=UPI000E126F2B|nr:quinone oxidoreductase [Cupriavidus taiwanensis]SOZ19253.1 Quinone oxidoreductase [Cupriavidus taiwanensis]SOZ32438.1 Quinone oxidoreductase [Cupriavidus taiwanensis]SOZ48029.1 Quinone oxidoreductase [Cupriavidus taiwanensis]SPA22127.1 Quinone oxidoreductase [Cupriavidus taiwanensis]
MLSESFCIYSTGGPEVLQACQIPVPAPGPGEVQLRQSAIGLNFADIYQRKGAHGPHAATPFPITLGSVGAGTVTAIGAGVEGLIVGQRVACMHPGAYQVTRNVPAGRLVPLPETIAEDVAGATLLRGLTAEYLLRRLYAVQPGDAVLVHAAAGGMGVLLSQWARALGAIVIGTVGSEAKRAVALAHGCHHVINYRENNFVDAVQALTGGEGVAVVYDAVGKDVFVPSLQCLRPCGMAINYGTASGDVEAFDLQLLHARSLIVSRPTLRTYIASPQALAAAAATLFEAVAAGQLRLEVTHRYPLAAVRDAHRDLESRATTGSAVLIP